MKKITVEVSDLPPEARDICHTERMWLLSVAGIHNTKDLKLNDFFYYITEDFIFILGNPLIFSGYVRTKDGQLESEYRPNIYLEYSEIRTNREFFNISDSGKFIGANAVHYVYTIPAASLIIRFPELISRYDLKTKTLISGKVEVEVSQKRGKCADGL